MSISEQFSNITPAILAAQARGVVRMQARLAKARVSAHADGPPPAAPASVDIDTEERRAALAAHQREVLIRAAFSNAASLDIPAEVVDRMIDAGTPPEELGDHLVKVFAKSKMKDSFSMQHSDSGSRVISSFDDPANVLEAMSDAIAFPALKALNPSHKLPDNGARDYMSFSGADYARECVARSTGRPASSMHLTRVVGEALGNTSSDFPGLLGTAANKVLTGSYEAAAPTYRAVFAQQNVNNFLPHSMVRVGDFPALLELNEHGEITRGSMSESAEIASLKSHGRTFGITRQALVNDSLGAFTSMAAKIGAAVASYENAVAWAVFLSNPTLATTSAAVFSVTHNNLTASGTAISADSLGVGRKMIRMQKSLDGVPLNIAPTVLLVPAAKETIAETVISPLVMPDTAGNLTPVGLRSPSLSLVVEPLLDANSITSWYLASNPARGSNFVAGRLAGAEAPRVRTNSPINVDGIEFQVLIDFFAAAVDFRFGYKNVGA